MFNLIESKEDLLVLNKELLSKPYIAIDTEFRRKTKDNISLSLIQVNDSEETFIIDCIKIGNAGKLCSFISSKKVKKILHSYKEDTEAIYSWTNKVLVNVFDTQLANAFLGGPLSISYGDLTLEKLGVRIDKNETRSNWLKRPLRDSQLIYAASDVEFLVELFLDQQQNLTNTNKKEWLEEEINFGIKKLFTDLKIEPIGSKILISKDKEKKLRSSFEKIVNTKSKELSINKTLLFSKKNQKDFIKSVLNSGLISTCKTIPDWKKELLNDELENLFNVSNF